MPSPGRVFNSHQRQATILVPMQIGVVAVQLHQVLMRAALDDLAFVYHVDAVRLAYGREAMCNDEYRATFADAIKVALDDRLGLVVEGAGGFIQNKDAWVR